MAAHFGRRLRRGAATTAVAAAAIAALSASQAPGVVEQTHKKETPDATHDDQSATGDSPYYTDLPPLHSPTPPPAKDHRPSPGGPEAGIPATVLDAYKKAAAALARSQPGCNLRWELLAAIGKVESGQARGGRVDANGTTLTPILGPVLDGRRYAKIPDTDGGRYDGDTVHDRAVGPMQFIPSTWSRGGPDHQGWGADGNGDGKKDPNNIYDAALAAARYLCASGRDLSDTAALHQAILSYNHSQDYLTTVLSWYEYYRKGTHEVPDGKGVPPHDRSDQPADRPDRDDRPNESDDPGDSDHSDDSDPGDSDPGDSDPGDPGDPDTPDDDDDGDDDDTDDGDDDDNQTPAEAVAAIENAGSGEELTAMAGEAFAERVKVRTEDEKDEPVARVRVQFAISGVTDATFEGGANVATVETGPDGTATAPVLYAGEQTGDFTVRVTVVGSGVPALDVDASVTPRRADALTRTSEDELVCVPGAQFEQTVQVKATYQGEAAPKVAATATLLKSADDPVENDQGPYFKDDQSRPVRTLDDLVTDENGLLELPALFADDLAGTFLLRITTEGGAQLDVELTVAEDTPTTPEPTPSPTVRQ